MMAVKWMVALAVAVPSLAAAQVGPNPAAQGGSLDPSVGPSRDPVTAPDDAKVGSEPTIARPPQPQSPDSSATDTATNAPSDARVTPPAPAKSRKKPR